MSVIEKVMDLKSTSRQPEGASLQTEPQTVGNSGLQVEKSPLVLDGSAFALW